MRVEPATADGKLDATALNDTNQLEIRVFANEAQRHAVVIARLDNLGKGASGAAVQNLRLMLGLCAPRRACGASYPRRTMLASWGKACRCVAAP